MIMDNKARQELQLSADALVRALSEYKRALEIAFHGDEHIVCYPLKREIIESEFRSVDKRVTEIITSRDGEPAECAVLGLHAAVVNHALFSVEHVSKTLIMHTVQDLVNSVDVSIIKEDHGDTARSN